MLKEKLVSSSKNISLGRLKLWHLHTVKQRTAKNHRQAAGMK